MGSTATVALRRQLEPRLFSEPRVACTALVPSGYVVGFWPVIKMSDGTYRKGPFAEIVGRWNNDG